MNKRLSLITFYALKVSTKTKEHGEDYDSTKEK